MVGDITSEEEKKSWPRLAGQKGRVEKEMSRRNERRTSRMVNFRT